MLEWILIPVLIVIYTVIRIVHIRDNSGKSGAPFVPLPPDVAERVVNLAEVKKGDVFYDLGSGDGRLVIAAAMKGAQAFGFEINPWRVWYSKLWIKILRLPNVEIINKNIFDVDFSKANVITAYLLQETNDKLLVKMEKEIKKGTRIVGIAFNLKGWKPKKIDTRGPIYGPLYFYTR